MDKGSGGTKSLLGLRTMSTAGNEENVVTMHEIAEALQLLVKVKLVKTTGTRNNGMNSNLNLKLEA